VPSEWGYVAVSFILVWAALVIYALLLARRVTQAQQVEESLRDAAGGEDTAVCDVQPAP
jgi:hypothetical protein